MHRWRDRRRYVPSQMKARCASQHWSTRAVRPEPFDCGGRSESQGRRAAMRELAERNRYPDINLGVMGTQDRGRLCRRRRDG